MTTDRETRLQEPEYELGPCRGEFVAMSDGVRLMTHVWIPKGQGPWPAILVRNPYVDGGNVKDPSLLQFVTYGYAVVLQECRGRGASEGVWEPYLNERQDGLDTLSWLVEQDWLDGNVGLYGGSYLSFNQWILADRLPPQVKTMYISVMGTDLNRFAYMDGMFRHDIYTSWSLSNAGVDWAGRDMSEAAHHAFRIRPPIEMSEQMMGKILPWYRGFLLNPGSGDPLWNDGLWSLLKSIPSKVNIPVCLVGGWFDIALDTMFRSYTQLKPEIREKSRFVVGPWVHSLAPCGDLEYPGGWVEGTNGGTKAVVEWFDSMLKGKPYPDALGVVHAYAIGENRWMTWDSWPPRGESVSFYLNGSQALGKAPSTQANSASYTYYPDFPVPTNGGSGLLSVYSESGYLPKSACVRQPDPGYRDDVISFLSDPLEHDLFVTGQIKIVLNVGSTAEDTAFTVKVIEVFPGGEAYNVADGITSMAYRNESPGPVPYEPNAVERIVIDLWPISWRFKKGSVLRLDVSSSNFPAYHVHPNIAGNWAEQKTTASAVQTLYWGGPYASYLELPVQTVPTSSGR
jgi:uncharacterized protein